jgi:LacI family transcriptional regulator
MNKKRISIHDVAKKAGSSITTVSRIINGTDYPVSEERRKRILEAIRELNYSPNTAAQMLKKGFSNVIGLIVRDIADPYFGEIARGVSEQAGKLGFLCFVCNTGRNPESEIEYMELLWRHKVRGIILSGGGLSTRKYVDSLKRQLDRGKQYGLRIIGLAPQALSIPYVSVDYAATAEYMTAHLYDRGHRSIAFVSGAEIVLTTRDHLRGYRRFLESRNIAFDTDLVAYGDFTERAGHEGCSEIMSRGKPFTAVFCGSDTIAMGVINCLEEKKLRVPRDVSVVGIGDIPQSRYIIPPLTTVKIPRYEMGARAVDMIARPEESFLGEDVVFKPVLVERQSVKNLSR